MNTRHTNLHLHVQPARSPDGGVHSFSLLEAVTTTLDMECSLSKSITKLATTFLSWSLLPFSLLGARAFNSSMKRMDGEYLSLHII